MSRWLDPERIARLRQKQETSFTPTYLHRPAAILLLIPLADVAWITPNLLTTLNVVMRLVVAWMIWPESMGGPVQTPALLWSAIFLWHLGGSLDAADGTLARYRGGGSLFGRYYDKVSDRVITLCLVLSLSARCFEANGELMYVLMALIYVAMMSASSVAKWIELGLRFEMEEHTSKVTDPGEVPAPKRSFMDWTKFLVFKLRYIFVVTEMDLPLWGSVALVTGREDWLFVYLAVSTVPYSLFTLFKRGFRMRRMEREYRQQQAESSAQD